MENSDLNAQSSIEHDINILEENKLLDDHENNKKQEVFKKTTYWHQQSSDIQKLNNESLIKEMSDCLLRIEAKLAKIETLLDK